MRVKPPADGAPPVLPVDGTTASEPVDAAAPVSQAPRVTEVRATSASDPVGEVARLLKAGAISATQAVDLLIDHIVERETGGTLARRRALGDELKTLLHEQAESDPFLAARVKRLGRPT